ncbi:MAG TPA: beta-galactosidase GalA [Tepidisphaeraceae bacterium]|jgi:beta-galactosidase|nr:beta-galactosidase GalA [Tepidisphaeraceae bacterium]
MDVNSSGSATAPRQRTLLDANWLFHRGDISPDTQVISANYDEQQWQHVDLPHDYVIDEPFSESNDRNHGYRPFVPGWYRKHLFIPQSDQGKILKLDFDGVFRDSQVWLNGQPVGHHLSGYTPFSCDITNTAKLGADNVITVRVDPRNFEGWWYEGGGIYRHVYLTALAPVHIAQFGTHVVSTVPNGDQGAHDQANLNIQTTLENAGTGPANCQVAYEILDPNGKSLQKLNVSESLTNSEPRDVALQTTLQHPKLWSLDSPQLYQLRTTILQDGHPVDATTTTFGIRTIRYDANKGFFLNGQHVEIQGVACHQDFAGVGIAVTDSLEFWRVQQFKKMGCNAWRTAHNPPTESVLDACDRLGMLVMDENRHLGDAYTHHSPAGTTANDLSDLATMIQRDRNHPSIIMWSMCNEEILQGTPEGASLFTAMAKVVHRYDTSRPVTSAMNGTGGVKIFFNPGIADVEDIIGVNYNNESYDAIHKKHPDKSMFGSEDSNDKTARGQYVDDRAAGMSSAYNLSQRSWLSIETRPYIAGSFTWTGFDYKGEPNPFGWPDVSNNTGLVDSCGFPKDKYYYFESCWSSKPMVHLLPITWNAPITPGKPDRVIAFSNAKQVELFLNGKSLGTKNMPHDAHVEWQVPFQPGTLLAKAYTDGKTIATDEVQTTTAPTRIVLSPDRKTLHADGEDTLVVPVSLLDDQGRVVPDSTNRVTFHLTGNGKIVGVGNGNPADHDPDKADNRNAFHGRCIVVLQAGAQPSTLQLTASSPGLQSASITLKIH